MLTLVLAFPGKWYRCIYVASSGDAYGNATVRTPVDEISRPVHAIISQYWPRLCTPLACSPYSPIDPPDFCCGTVVAALLPQNSISTGYHHSCAVNSADATQHSDLGE
jgi:hypothetical protein